jgi:hypothetical protein
MQPMLGLLRYDCQSTGASDKYYLKKYVLLHNVLNYYNLGLYKQNLNLWDIRLSPSEIVQYFNLNDTGDNTKCRKQYLGLYPVLIT